MGAVSPNTRETHYVSTQGNNEALNRWEGLVWGPLAANYKQLR